MKDQESCAVNETNPLEIEDNLSHQDSTDLDRLFIAAGEESVNVEGILKKIRSEIKKQKISDKLAAYKSLSSSVGLSAERERIKSLHTNLMQVNEKWGVFGLTNQIIGDSKKGKIKRIMLKILGWPSRLYFLAQIEVNTYIARTLNESYLVHTMMQQRVEAQNEKIMSQDAQILALGKANREIKSQLETLKRQIESLDAGKIADS